MKVFLREQFASHSWDVFLYRDCGDSGRYFRQPDGSDIFLDANTASSDDLKPTFRIDYHTAQHLITALQAEGVRPVEITKVEGILEAQTKHLEDLRNILKTKKVMS